jgi:hypothetical protein
MDQYSHNRGGFFGLGQQQQRTTARERFIAITASVLEYLGKFVGDDNVRISAFASSGNDNNLLSSLQVGGKKNKGENELQLIASFFQEEDGSMGPSGSRGDDLLHRLTCAFQLRRFKNVLSDVLSIIDKDLKMTRLYAELTSARVIQQLEDPVTGDFIVREAPTILASVQGSLQGLTIDELEIIRALRLPSAGLLLAFFRQHAQEQSFRASLNSATEQATRNEHVSGLIGKLYPLWKLLRPFYDPNSSRMSEMSIQDLKHHLTACLQQQSDAEQVATDLTNVIENYAEFSDYFVESTNSSDIIRSVPRYLRYGEYFSTLSTSKYGQGLFLKYGSGGLTRRMLGW